MSTIVKIERRQQAREISELEMITYGQTIEIRPKGAQHWEHVATVNPAGDSSKGIPVRADREFAQLIVNSVNAFLNSRKG